MLRSKNRSSTFELGEGMKTCWWYDDATFNSDRSTLYLACLRVLADGTAVVAVEGFCHVFESEDAAGMWLTDEEFYPVDSVEQTTDASGTSTFTYDDLNRLKTATPGTGQGVSYTYTKDLVNKRWTTAGMNRLHR